MKRYAEYKDSGVPWIGEIPGDWEVVRFSTKFCFDRGLPITKADLKDDGIPCISYGEIHSKYGFEVNPSIHLLRNVDMDYLQTNPNSILKKGDFIFADTSEDIDGSGNFTHLSSGVIAFAGYHSIIARLKDNSIYYRYIAYYFDSMHYRSQIQSKVCGIKVFSITQSILKNTRILLPPIQTQHSIADYLDRKTAAIDTLISDKQKMIDLLKEKRQAIISETVTKGLDKNAKMKDSGVEWIGEIPKDWEIIKIKYLCNIKRGASPRPIDDPKYFDENGDRYWVRISDITSSKKYLEKCEQALSPEGIKCSVKINEDDFFVSICASVGKPCISKVKACIHDGFVLFEKLDKNLNEYMYFLFETKLPFAGLGKMGTQLNLNSETIGNIYIPIHQNVTNIINYLNAKTAAIDTLIFDIETQIEKLKEYRQAIISEAVTGKVAI